MVYSSMMVSQTEYDKADAPLSRPVQRIARKTGAFTIVMSRVCEKRPKFKEKSASEVSKESR